MKFISFKLLNPALKLSQLCILALSLSDQDYVSINLTMLLVCVDISRIPTSTIVDVKFYANIWTLIYT